MHYKNVFDREVFDHISDNIKQFKTYIFCDGGNKLRELNLYARLLKSGDRIAVHDWGIEIHPNQGRRTVTISQKKPVPTHNFGTLCSSPI